VLNKLKKYTNLDIRSLLDQSIRDNEKAILALNRDQMWSDGTVDVNRPRIKEHYSDFTIPLKKKFARYKKTSFITLRWDGDFYESLYIEHEQTQFVIKSDDPTWLFSLEPQVRFENTLGLTRGSKAILRDIVRTDILRKVRNAV